MLIELKVSNFAIIDNVHMNFGMGLNILSGETGAGKSILLKSLGLLMGEKALSDTIRSGQETATIEGAFDLSKRPDIKDRMIEMGIEVLDNELIVKRIVSNQNKSRIYLNGSLSTLASLRDVVSPLVEVTGQAVPLIEMTGQHDNRNLLSPRYHLDLLDQYSGAWKSRADYESKYLQFKSLQDEIIELSNKTREKNQRLDFLIYQRDEIKALDLRSGEEELIENETKRLKYTSRLTEFVEQAERTLFDDEDSVNNKIHFVLQRSHEIRKVDETLSAKFETLEQARTLINDLAYELRDYAQKLEADPEQLEQLEQRLSKLRGLQKKYGSTADEILKALESIEEEISVLENSENEIAEKQKLVASLQVELNKIANELHKKRVGAAELLSKTVGEELKDLNMKGVSFVVRVERLKELNSTGISHAEFATQNSKTDEPKSLSKFASGGELSRILLSIKRVVGHAKYPRTYLFDEVDAGVSGPTAEKVGRKLKSIANGSQVICITHLPQVASFGDIHFFIQKSQTKNSVQMEVTELKNKDRVQEIARLISGEKITKTSLAHAEQLLKETSH
jgi:DNA repair protein RecN (Recombination protein N)